MHEDPGAHGGVLFVDKPGGMTSHDVVARARRALNTRKIGHAGTLDPMATGLLTLGVGPATRLLTYLVGLDKTYTATIRLGVATDTDDAEGEVVATAEASDIDSARIAEAVAAHTGAIAQVPSRVSAIKVDGRRAYERARAGEQVDLPARAVVVSRFEIERIRRGDRWCDVDVSVDCSSGTYVRALARDVGGALSVGGHLTALRRIRVGPFDVSAAVGMDDVATASLLSPARVAAAVMPGVHADAQQSRDLRHGKRVSGLGAAFTGPRAAAMDPQGALIGIVERRGEDVKSVMNMPEEQQP